MRQVEKQFLLQMIDMQWREHLMHLDHLRNVIGLRGYGQRDPLNEYKTEAFSLFESLLNRLRTEVTRMLAHVQVMTQEEQAAMIADIQARGRPSRPSRPPSRRSARRSRSRRWRWRAATAPLPRRSPARRRRRRPRDLGRERPQRSLPLRLGQEVQALPRAGLTRPGDRAGR